MEDERRDSEPCVAELGQQHRRCTAAERRQISRLSMCSKPRTLLHHKHSSRATHSAGFLLPISLSVAFLVLSLPTVILAREPSTQPTTNPFYHKLQTWNTVELKAIETQDRLTLPRWNLPDQSATVGRLFFYQLPHGNVTKYQAREAGRRRLPQWLHFDQTTGVFMGVPWRGDAGEVYISVDMHYNNGESGIEGTVFLLEVRERKSDPLDSYKPGTTRPEKPAQQLQMSNSNDGDPSLSLPKSKCMGGYPPKIVLPNDCATNLSTVLANFIFLADFPSLDGLQRSSLFLAISEHIGVCSEQLFVRDIDWSRDEWWMIWTQLTESDFSDYLEIPITVLSLTVACGSTNDSFEELFASFETLVTDEDGDVALNGKGGSKYSITFFQWFLSNDASILRRSQPRSTTVSRKRIRRQIEEISLETALPMVSSTPVPQTSSLRPTETTLTRHTSTASESLAPSPSAESRTVSLQFVSSQTAPSTRVIPTSEASRAFFTVSPSHSLERTTVTSATLQTLTSFEFVVTTLPVMSLSFSPSLIDRTSIVMTDFPTRSFTVRSSIEVSTSSFQVSSSDFILPTITTEIFVFSTTPIVEPTPSFSESQLLPMSSPELTMSVSIFTPTVSPESSSFVMPEPTTIIFLSTETFIPPTTVLPTPEVTFVSTRFPPSSQLGTSFILFPSSSRLESSTMFTVESSPIFPTLSSEAVSSTVASSPSPSLTSPMSTMALISSSLLASRSSRSRSILMPMSSQELSLSASIFTPSPSSQIEFTSTELLPLPETTIMFSPQPSFSSPVLSRSSSLVLESSISQVFPSPTPTPPLSSAAITPSPTPASICDFIDCGNGTCVDLATDFECVCYTGWTGDFCASDIDFCNPFPCFQNNTISCEDGNSTYTCNCVQGFAGQNCTEEDPCDPNPCLNGGTCIPQLMGGFECICPRDILGMICEIVLDPCMPDPCDAGEVCIDLGRQGFLCSVLPVSSTPIISFSSITERQSSDVIFSMLTVSSRLTSSLSPTAFISTASTPSPSPTFTASPSRTTTSIPSLTFSSSSSFLSLSSATSSSRVATSTPSLTFSSSSLSLSSTTLSSPTATSTPSLTSFPSSLPLSSATPSLSSPTSSLSPSPSSSPLSTSSSAVAPSPTPSPSPIQNDPPVLLNPIGTILTNEGRPFQLTIREATFHDAEDGFSSNLTLSLLDSNGIPIPNSSWIQLRGDMVIEGLPLSSEVQSSGITDYVFILRAQDSFGASTHDFVTVRVRPQASIANLLVVFFEGEFEIFNENLTAKVELAKRLSAASGGLTQDNLYVKEFRSGSIGVVYTNLLISDFSCAEFHEWVRTVYQNGRYTTEFLQSISPFRPVTGSAPTIEGPCATLSVNVVPTVGVPPDINTQSESELVLFLAVIVPAVVVALLLFLLALLCFLLYRRRRKERDYLHEDWQSRAFLNRRPVILAGEAELPPRARRPIVLPNEAVRTRSAGRRWRIGQALPPPLSPRLEVEDVDLQEETSSDEELVDIPFLSAHARQPLHKRDPPRYRLPPDYLPTS